MTANQWKSLTPNERTQLHYVLHVQGWRHGLGVVPLICERKIYKALLKGELGGLDEGWACRMIVKLMMNR